MEHKEAVETKEYTYTAVFQPAEEGGYVVTFPALRGCITQGAPSKMHARWPPTLSHVISKVSESWIALFQPGSKRSESY